MNQLIYNSNNQESILKAYGPYRIQTANQSMSNVQLPYLTLWGKPSIIKAVAIFGSNENQHLWPQDTELETEKAETE